MGCNGQKRLPGEIWRKEVKEQDRLFKDQSVVFGELYIRGLRWAGFARLGKGDSRVKATEIVALVGWARCRKT